jgi:hypothetical protein
MLSLSAGSKNKTRKWNVPPERRPAFKGLQDVISQKTELFAEKKVSSKYSKEEGLGHI